MTETERTEVRSEEQTGGADASWVTEKVERWEEVGTVDDFADGQRRILSVDDREVCVFKANGRFYALNARCLHQGGPVAEGMLIGKVEAVLGPDRRLTGERFSEDEIHLVCPWHGWEYDIETGECAGDRSLKLPRYEVDVRGDVVYVKV